MIVHAQYLSMPIAVLNKSSLRLLYIYEPLKENIKEYYTEISFPLYNAHQAVALGLFSETKFKQIHFLCLK